MPNEETIDQAWPGSRAHPGAEPLPGFVLISSRGEPLYAASALGRDTVTVGRGQLAGVALDDPCLSRKHASIAREGTGWVVRDLDSRNGSAIDGAVFKGERRFSGDAVLRAGDTLLLLREDVRAFIGASVEAREDAIVGPR